MGSRQAHDRDTAHLVWQRSRKGRVREAWRGGWGQARALCSRWMRINLNSEAPWGPPTTSEPGVIGSKLASGNCNEFAAGMGGPGEEAAINKTSWELENPLTLLLSVSPESHMGLGVIL